MMKIKKSNKFKMKLIFESSMTIFQNNLLSISFCLACFAFKCVKSLFLNRYRSISKTVYNKTIFKTCLYRIVAITDKSFLRC